MVSVVFTDAVLGYRGMAREGGKALASSERIDGWKAIGAHFGRDRTTAIRWAQSRALPVRRMPGGKKATVYALKSELDLWARGQPDGPDESATTPGLPPVPPRVRPLRRIALLVTALLALAAVVAIAVVWRAPAASQSPRLPADAATARLYLQARDDWAKRTPASLDRAIAGLVAVAARDPGFAPAHSGLADAFLLAREFGAMDDAMAFDRARTAAQTALRIDPQSAASHRARGFILYWRDHDARAAGQAFRRAKALAPNDAQTHFWYGNVLADNGASGAALRELNAARLIEPGSVAIRTDLAWALWSAGNTDEAVAMLTDLARANPDFAVVHDCLGTIRFARGDLPGYVASFSEFARLRGEAGLMAHAADLRAALGQGPAAVRSVMMARARAELAGKPWLHHGWAAFIASVAGDRTTLRTILRQAQDRRERWGDAGIRARIALRWRDDPEISAMLARLAAPAIE